MNFDKIPAGLDIPNDINVAIEIPAESSPVKYEIDKASGFIKVDRPQKFSNIIPALYGFIPQTYCAEEVAKICKRALESRQKEA